MNDDKTPYELSGDGAFCPHRDHETEFGWLIYHQPTGRIFARVGEKSCCFGLSAALNGHYEAAKVFLEGSTKIDDSYFERFNRL